MHILLFIPFTQNSLSALFHDAKIPNLALFRESKIPNMRGTGPIPNEAKKIAGFYFFVQKHIICHTILHFLWQCLFCILNILQDL